MFNVAARGSLDMRPQKLSHLRVRPIVAIWSLLAIITCTLLCVGGRQVAGLNQQQIVSAASLQAHTNHRTALTPAKMPITTPATSPAPESSRLATTPTQACVSRAVDITPDAIGLMTAPDGLTKHIDSPQSYQIYGTNASSLRSQIRQCAPKPNNTDSAEFTAETSYKLTWRYSVTNDSGGMCHVSHAKVGLHVGQVMPLWQPVTAADASLVGQWRSFMSALVTHENGHTGLDIQYAQMLLNDLNTFPATPCAQLSQAVKHLTDSDVATLNQANDNYDSSTNHGATQGATLPQ